MTPRRRATAGLTSILLTAAGLAAGVGSTTAPAAAASDPTPGYAVHSISVEVTVGPHDDHRCPITADVYRPDGTGPRHRAPAILTTHGFGGSKDDAQQSATGRLFARAGFVVLSYSGLGFGGSGCKIHLDDPDWDGKAGSQLVDVLAGKKRYTVDRTGRHKRIRFVSREQPGDPRVGMIGGSYGGEIQFAVAEQDQRIDALIPLITWNDLSYSLAPNNTSFRQHPQGSVTYRTPGVAKREWIDLFFGLGITDGVDDVQVDPSRDVGCPNFADDACPAAAQLNTLGYPDHDTLALARHASVSSYLDRVKAPTLLVQGQADTLFNLQESVATFRALRHHHTPARLVWQSWGHSDSTPAPGELDFDAASLRDSYLGRRFLHWMDHYVAGRRHAPVGPRFSYFRDWVHYDTSPSRAGHTVTRAYATRRHFSQRARTHLFVSGHGFRRSTSRVHDTSVSYANASGAPTSYSETSGLEGNQVDNPPSDADGTVARFTSRRLARPTAVVGSPRLTLHLDAPVAGGTQRTGPGGQLILFAKVYDVARNGDRRLAHRLVAPVRVADVTQPVHVVLPGVVHRFAKGHRIQLVVAASDAAYANNAAVQPVTVTSTSQHPTVLRLPTTSRLRLR